MALTAACALIAVASTSLPTFYAALLCLGVGWNFMFVGGTTLLARSYRPSEKAKVQGAAELIRFTVTALASLVAGPMLERFGWADLNLMSIPLVVIAGIMTLYWIRDERRLRRGAVALA
jgi:MFS family permease